MPLSPDVGRAFYGHFPGLHAAQRAAIEPLLAGADVLVLSGTGSGKTEAVIAPLVDRYRSGARDSDGPFLLYVTPTRALANDLLRRLEAPLERLGLSVGIRHGERNDLARRRAPDLLITTPESLDVLLTSRSRALGHVRVVVLDEVHLTYNTQRGFQLAILLRRLEGFVGKPLQVAGLSATIARPSDIWSFFRPERDCVVVEDAERKPFDYYVAPVDGMAELAGMLDKASAGGAAKVLLFANARQECDRLAAALRGRTRFGEQVFVHHSSLGRDVRLATERAFQEAPAALCVATSTLELGIDVGDVDLVALYGHPGGWESLLQRAGRGSRRAHKTNLLCLVSPDHGPTCAGALAFETLMAQVRGGRLEREPPVEIYGAAAQQILSLLLERDGAYRSVSDLAGLFSDWAHLDRETVEEMLNYLAAGDYVRPHAIQRGYGAGEQAHRLRELRLIWGNFPLRSREVKLATYGRDLGMIPASNALTLRPGMVVRFAGRAWRVRRVGPAEILVDPCEQAPNAEIVYPRAGVPLDPATVEEMLRLLASPTLELPMEPGLRQELLQVVERAQPYIGWDRLAVAQDDQGYCSYFTFAGRAVNCVIAAWAGCDNCDIGNVVLRTEEPIDFASLPADHRELRHVAARATRVLENLTAFQMALPPEFIERELADVWVKTPVFARSLARLRDARIVPAPLAAVAALCI